jgi:GST-like protein
MADVADGRLWADAGPGAPLSSRSRTRPTAAYGLKRYSREPGGSTACWTAAGGREFVADALSVADFAILGWAWRHPRHKVELKDFPNVERWYNALMARPATKRGMEAKLD